MKLQWGLIRVQEWNLELRLELVNWGRILVKHNSTLHHLSRCRRTKAA